MCFVCLSVLAISPGGAPNLAFEFASVDRGVVKAAGTVEVAFPFTARGPVEILDARPSCGCLRTQLAKRKYAAGERGAIPLRIHVASQAEGKKRFVLTLLVRDPTERTVTLSAEMTLQSDVKVTPSNLIVHLPDGETARQRIELRDRRPRPLQMLSVATSRPEIVARLRNPEADGHVHYIDVNIANTMPVGKHEAKVEIRALNAESPAFPETVTIEVPIVVVRPGPYALSPEYLRLRRADLKDGPVTRTFVLLDRDAQGRTVRFESADPHVAAMVKRESPLAVRVRVTVKPDAATTVAKLTADGRTVAEIPIEIRD
jgi:hypothetical protein